MDIVFWGCAIPMYFSHRIFTFRIAHLFLRPAWMAISWPRIDTSIANQLQRIVVVVVVVVVVVEI